MILEPVQSYTTYSIVWRVRLKQQLSLNKGLVPINSD